MQKIDTLFIVSSKRGAYVLDDIVTGIAVTTAGTYFVLVVDETGKVERLSIQDNYQILYPGLPPEAHSGFKRAQALVWAFEQQIVAQQVIMLDDTVLVREGSLSRQFLAETAKPGVGVVGVGDSTNYATRWQAATTLFNEWGLNVSSERPPAVLADAVLILSAPFVTSLYHSRLLTPPGLERWPTTYGAYLAWCAYLTKYYTVAWGYTNKPLPPLYVGDPSVDHIPTHMLIGAFSVYSPVGSAMSYSEQDLRELFKRDRGQPSREFPASAPAPTAPKLN